MFDSNDSANDGSDNNNSNSEKKSKFEIETYWESIKGKWQRSDVVKKIPAAPLKTKFEHDLKRGQKSEHDFYLKYASCIVRTDGRRGDYELLKTGEVLELKSDYYNPNETPNFFMERFSYEDKAGGPWQALEYKVSYYIYWYPTTGVTYIFNVQQLVRRLNKLSKKLDLVNVRNQGYITQGYLVERSMLQDLFLAPEDVGLYGK